MLAKDFLAKIHNKVIKDHQFRAGIQKKEKRKRRLKNQKN
jgi:hypothetical protein